MYENFICTTTNCAYYDESLDCGCSKGAITIEEHHCADFEESDERDD